MKFDSNRAWQEATAAASASRSVLLPVAGVFFLIPGVATSFFLGDIQERMMANLANRDVLNGIIEAEMGKIIGISLLSLLAGMIGYLALLVLLTDQHRPTVGEAMMRGIKYLPTLIAAVLLGYIGMFVVMVVIGAIGGLLTMAIGGTGAAFMVIAVLAVLVWLAVKLSLTMPVVVVEQVMNPVAAMARSWRLTKGHAPQLLGFYALLFIGYLVIALVLTVFVGAIGGLLSGGGTAGEGTLIATGLVSGAIGAVVGVLFSAVLAAIHRQLSGATAGSVGETFA